jgi:predicted dehydrogenase
MTTRRDFIRTTAATGLIAALPGCVSSTSPNAPLRTPATLARGTMRTRRPDEELRVAVIGVRGRGWNHVQAFQRLDHVEVVALCDCDRAVLDRRAAEFERTHGRSIDGVIDYRDLLDRSDIDIVSIATPNHWHALMTVEACNAGKDVYVEKPVSHNIAEGERILEAAAVTGRIVQAGTQSRSCPAIRDGIAWMHEGHIGGMTVARGLCYKPRQSIGLVDGPQTPPNTIDYDLWCGPAPMKPLMRRNLHYDWHWDTDTGNGDIGNQGIHQMDVCRWAIGASSMPRRVASIGGRVGYRDDGNTPNTQVALLEYGTIPLLFEVRGLPRDQAAQTRDWNGSMDTFMDQRIASIIHCDGGALIVPTGARDCWAVDESGRRIESWSESADHFANFISAVRSRDSAELNADIIECVRSSDLCHLASISHALGTTGSADEAMRMADDRTAFGEATARMLEHLRANAVDVDGSNVLSIGPSLDIDPARDRFINQDAANALLSREERVPFTFSDLS